MQVDELLDLYQCEAEFLIALDERYSIEIAGCVTAVSGTVPRGSWKDPLPLIKPDGLDVYGGLARQFPDVHANIVNPIHRYKARTKKSG